MVVSDMSIPQLPKVPLNEVVSINDVYIFLKRKCPLCGSERVEKETIYNVISFTSDGGAVLGNKIVKLKCLTCGYELYIVVPHQWSV